MRKARKQEADKIFLLSCFPYSKPNPALANDYFVLQSNPQGTKMGRRKPANHPHVDGTLRRVSSRARAHHAFRRGLGRGCRCGRTFVSFGFAAGFWRALDRKSTRL